MVIKPFGYGSERVVMLMRILLVSMVLLLVLVGCSRNSGDRNQKLEYGTDTYRFTAVVVDIKQAIRT